MHRLPTALLATLAALVLPVFPALSETSPAGQPVQAGTDAETQARIFLERIEALDDKGPGIHAVVAVNRNAPQEAARAELRQLPLGGRAVLVKDNIETREFATTAGSLALEDNHTGRDAPLIARLRQAGGVVLGKANLSEWANIRSSDSTSGWSAVGGQTRNPHAIDRNPCGSSAGSAAAIAADFAWAAIGTETDGSISCPASTNGVVGFKPTLGLVSRTYVIPISHSQDTAGPMARTVEDAALLLGAIAGSDPADPATEEADARKTDYTRGLADASLSGVRIGVLRNQVGKHPGVAEVFQQALADLAAAGAVLVDIDYDFDERMWDEEYAVLLFELREGLDDYLSTSPADIPVRSLADVIAFNREHEEDEMRWFGQDIFEQALNATDREAYEAALASSRRMAGEDGIDRLLRENEVEFLIAPTSGPAWPIDPVNGDNFQGSIGAGSLAAIAGYPHLSVPMGAVEELPVGLSIIGPQWADHAVLKAGAAYERTRSAELLKPSMEAWNPDN